MPSPIRLFIPRTPAQINGHLAALDGQILLIIDNYTQVYEKPPRIKDGVSSVYEIAVAEEDLTIRTNNGVDEILIWRGEKNASSRPHDKAQVPVRAMRWPKTVSASGDPISDEVPAATTPTAGAPHQPEQQPPADQGGAGGQTQPAGDGQ